MDRKHNVFGTPRLAPNPHRKQADALQLHHDPMLLNNEQRALVEKVVREVCRFRGYALMALNARTNHVHVVVSASCKPEPILEAFKAYSTRTLRRARMISADTKVWVRHGSTRYLWKDGRVAKAIDYVLYGQGDDPLDFEA